MIILRGAIPLDAPLVEAIIGSQKKYEFRCGKEDVPPLDTGIWWAVYKNKDVSNKETLKSSDIVCTIALKFGESEGPVYSYADLLEYLDTHNEIGDAESLKKLAQMYGKDKEKGKKRFIWIAPIVEMAFLANPMTYGEWQDEMRIGSRQVVTKKLKCTEKKVHVSQARNAAPPACCYASPWRAAIFSLCF